MKKIIILVVVLVLISIGLVSCFYFNNRNKENKLLNQKDTSNEVIVSNDDMGCVIGKSGKIANAIRTIIQASSYANGEKKSKNQY